MSYEEKGSWVYLVVVTGTCLTYAVTIAGRVDADGVAAVGYRAPMLWTMGIGMVLAMVGRIGLELVRPSETYRKDVRDRDIGRHAEYIGGTVLATGMVVPFALTLAAAHHFWIANAMFAAFALSTVVGAAVRIVAYRRGLRTWASQPG